MEHHEIERKFLVAPADLPADLSPYEAHAITQGYLCTKPTVRVRKENDSYYLTYKGAPAEDGLDREEYNLPLTKAAYETLLSKCDGTVISKTRYHIPLTGSGCAACGRDLMIELDVFHAPFEGLFYAEVEFEDTAAAKAFVPPAWFGREVTDDKRFSNAALSRSGTIPEM